MQVNMKKVNMDVMQRWIAQRITSLLGFEDDIVVGTCVNYLAEEVRAILKSNVHMSWTVRSCLLPFGSNLPHINPMLLLYLVDPTATAVPGRKLAMG